jgi:hypothetical protein
LRPPCSVGLYVPPLSDMMNDISCFRVKSLKEDLFNDD